MKTLKIKGLGERSRDQVQFELEQGARFVVFEYVVSVLFFAFLVSSPVYYIPPGEESRPRGFRWVLYRWVYGFLSMTLGLWGFPMGTLLCAFTIRHNFRGGRDVTYEVASLLGFDLGEPSEEPWLHRLLYQEIGPRTDVKFMTRRELLRSGLAFTVAGLIFNLAFMAILLWLDRPGHGFGSQPALLYVAYPLMLLGLLGLAAGLYLLLRGALRSRSYVPPEDVVDVDVVIVD